MKNQTKKSTLLLTIVAAIALFFSACDRDSEKYDLIGKELIIHDAIKGIVIDGPWEVTFTQDDENNSAFIQYNVPDKKIRADLWPDGYLHIFIYNLSNYRNVKLKATIKAATLEKIDGSGAAIIYTYGNFNSSADISLSGASILDGYACEGDNEVIYLSGASIMKRCSFKGKSIDATLSGSSNVFYSNIEVERCTVKASGASIFNGSGYAEKTDFNGSGSSTFLTFELASENLDIDLSGASNGEVTVNHKIKGTLSGASILKYKKAEDISGVSTTGGSKIIKVN